MQETLSVSSTDRGIRARSAEGGLRVDVLEPGIVRVRKFPGDEAPVSPLVRYGFFRGEWPAAEFRLEETDDSVTVSTERLAVTVGRKDGALSVQDASGRELLREVEPATSGPDPGFRARFHLPAGRALFGLGDQTREHIEHRGARGDLWVRNVKSYIPIPFLLTSDGFGLLVNTTRRVRYDLGASSAERLGLEADGATLDYYVLHGPSLKEIVARYTEVTGKPALPPKWSMGLWFICRTQADARELMDDCYSFRREHIPCDAISLEPGWMAKKYDFSVEKDWHPERFPVPKYARKGRHNFLSAARRMGFKPGLWLCCDYDLSYEEERQIRERATHTEEGGTPPAGYEQDKKLSGVKRLDPWTRVDEPWFKHLEDFVDQGVEWFKQDGANQVLEHPDRLWGNGMTDDEMHNLYPLLYSKQMYEGFRAHTGRRPFCFTPAGWAGLQRYTGTWTGDTGGEEGPLGACLNLSMSGHGMTTCDMEVTTREGIHFGFLMPWSQLDSWNYWRHPWLQGDELNAIFLAYARLRYRLVPYLYSCARDAHVTGIPMMRAMPLEFPDDRATYTLTRQYMLGSGMLVGAFTRSVYLPEGEWFDFWTGQGVSGSGTVEPAIPADRGGPLFVPAGAVIPMGPDIDYVGQRPDHELTIHVYAGAPGEFVLYEDDGETYQYEQGGFRTTAIRHQAANGRMQIEMAGAQGTFDAAPEQRQVQFVIHGLSKPSRVRLNGLALPLGEQEDEAFWRWDETASLLTVCAGERKAADQVALEI